MAALQRRGELPPRSLCSRIQSRWIARSPGFTSGVSAP
jgi:hypothetical protein